MASGTGERRLNWRAIRDGTILAAVVIAGTCFYFFRKPDATAWSAVATVASVAVGLIALFVAERSALAAEQAGRAAEQSVRVAESARLEAGPIPYLRLKVESFPHARRTIAYSDSSRLQPVLRQYLSIALENHGNTQFSYSGGRITVPGLDLPLPLPGGLRNGTAAERSSIGDSVPVVDCASLTVKECEELDGKSYPGAQVVVDIPGFGEIHSEPFVLKFDEVSADAATLEALATRDRIPRTLSFRVGTLVRQPDGLFNRQYSTVELSDERELLRESGM